LRAPGGNDAFVILPENIRVEPLAPAVLAGDDEWFLIVRWVLFAQIAAEQHGLTQANIERAVAESHDPRVRRLSAGDGSYGKALHIRGDWVVRAIAAVGNYGEMFERNLGSGSTLKLERGLSRLWTDGGLMYAPPFR
jgi:general L-amino acid transport system substrate-binding protein